MRSIYQYKLRNFYSFLILKTNYILFLYRNKRYEFQKSGSGSTEFEKNWKIMIEILKVHKKAGIRAEEG